MRAGRGRTLVAAMVVLMSVRTAHAADAPPSTTPGSDDGGSATAGATAGAPEEKPQPVATAPTTPVATAPTTQDNNSESGCAKGSSCGHECSSCRTRCCARSSSCACRAPSVSLAISGIRPSLTRVASPGTTTTDLGVAFAGQVDTYALDGASHGSMQFVLGGGEAGLEGMLAGVVDIGYRIDVTPTQGPFGRAAFDGRLQGNDRFYYSALELPRMTAGWQFLSGKTVLEIGGRAGPILTGRFNPGDAGKRSISGSLEFGAFVSAQIDFLRFDATAMRIEARKTGNGSPVDVGRAAICGVAGRLGVCADFMVVRGDANMGPALGVQDAIATYGGVTFGLASW